MIAHPSWFEKENDKRRIKELEKLLEDTEADSQRRTDLLNDALDRAEELERERDVRMQSQFRMQDERDKLKERFEDVLSIAEHLFAMVPREVWRDTGDDDGQGHYEGDYRAAQIEERLIALRYSLKEEAGMTFDPDWVVPPGATLKEWFDENQMGDHALIIVQRLGLSEDEAQGLFDGDTPLTEDIARGLAYVTNVRKDMWLALEHNYRVGLAAGKKKA